MVVVLVGGWLSYDTLSLQLLSRLDSNTFVGDSHRESLFITGLELLVTSNFLGVGVGSLVAAYEKLGSDVLLPHNVFLELLVQYGVVLFAIFIYLLCRIYYLSRYSSDVVARFVVFSAILSLPVVGVVNSGYWLSPIIWCYLASIFVIAYYSRNYVSSSVSVIR